MSKNLKTMLIIIEVVALAVAAIGIAALLWPRPIDATMVVLPGEPAAPLQMVGLEAGTAAERDRIRTPAQTRPGVSSEAQLVIAQMDEFLVIAEQGFGEQLSEGEVLTVRAGETYTVEQGSVAQITFQDGSTIAIDGGATFSIEELQTGEQSRRMRLRLSAGRVFCRVKQLLGVGDAFEIVTPSSVASVRGTAFGVDVISDYATYVYTLEGTVLVQMGDQQVEVHAGEEVFAVVGRQIRVYPHGQDLAADEPAIVVGTPAVVEEATDENAPAGDAPTDGDAPLAGGGGAAADQDCIAAGMNAGLSRGEAAELCSLADAYGVPADQVFALRSAGLGIGNVRTALDLVAEYGITVDEIIARIGAGKSLSDIKRELRQK